MHLMTILAAILTGAFLGIALTALVARDGVVFDQRSIGPWTMAARTGSESIDPYARARLLVSGELPIANGEGFSLVAVRDSDGNVLDGRCIYRLSGLFPVARYWTLTLTRPDGTLTTNSLDRVGFTSAEIIRYQGTGFSIEIGATPLAGNWLPSPPAGPFQLILRLYETPLSATATVLETRMLPSLAREGCRP
ncbi:COG5402 Uncharacterized conserved protein [Rhabdaerophilaceae bacterium]